MKYIYLFLLVTGLSVLSSCRNYKPGFFISFSGPTQGTIYNITYQSRDSIDYQSRIESLLREFDMSVSTYEPASLISRFNKTPEDIRPDEYLRTVVEASRQIFEESNGAFDITIAPVVNAWGFGFTDPAIIDSALIDYLLQFVGMDKVYFRDGYLLKDEEGVMLDVNAIAQGYAVDVVSEFLESEGISNYLVEIGGEVRCKGINSRGQHWRIGIDKPIDGLMIPGVQMEAIISLSGRSLATSGNYRRFYEKDGIKYSHTIDPATGYPVQHGLLSATVIADDCMTADGWATAFMVIGLEESKEILSRRSDLEAYLIYNDEEGQYRSYHTKGVGKSLEKL